LKVLMRAVFFDGVEVSFDALEALFTEFFLSKQKVQFRLVVAVIVDLTVI